MKKYLTKSNLLTAVIFAVVLYAQAPTWFANSDVENKNLAEATFIDITSGNLIKVDNTKNYILFFWATWCAPCKVDMDRYKSSIQSGKIPKENFLAINPFEPPGVVSKFIKKENYPFTFVDDSRVVINELKIRSTPTVTSLEKGVVSRQSSGISLVGIFRAEWLFQ